MGSFCIGFIIGAVGGWKLANTLRESAPLLEHPAEPIGDSGQQEDASREPAIVHPWPQGGEDSSEEGPDGFKAARMGVEARMRELETRQERGAA